ncbi:cyclin-like protein [Pavlovales sp. CCMP2436]|nr:cyclin-like protein [Pavlovales sp. CCMP2436]|mmetsp:Transcript_6654/g.16105  ORF Transcript_6654/g.16105 Transcript_6654/m.16105 type:complete len:318 (+) Transcript_6654:3-956(+)
MAPSASAPAEGGPKDAPEGPDDETEVVEEQRVYGCDVIQEASVLLELPQVCAATAQALFHRFYARRSFMRHDVRHVAMGVLFLAAKVEESPRRIRDVLNVFNALFQLRDGEKELQPIDLHSSKYANMKTLVLNTERDVLAELGFILYTEHPHKFILNYVKLLCTDPALEKPLAQLAWNVINDSARTTVCLRFSPEAICCAAISMAARSLGLPLPTKPPWWEIFDVSKDDVDQVCGVMVDLYGRTKAKYVHLKGQRPTAAALRAAPSSGPLVSGDEAAQPRTTGDMTPDQRAAVGEVAPGLDTAAPPPRSGPVGAANG